MKATKTQCFALHRAQINMWLAGYQFRLWLKPANNHVFHEVKSMEYLMQHISMECDVVCYPQQPEMVPCGNGYVIAPISGVTVLGDTITTVYTPKTDFPEQIWDQHSFYSAVKVGSAKYEELLPQGLLYLRSKDAVKVSKHARKLTTPVDQDCDEWPKTQRDREWYAFCKAEEDYEDDPVMYVEQHGHPPVDPRLNWK